MMTMIRLTAVLLAFFLASAAYASGSVVLRTSVRLATEGPIVRLADIAELTGEATAFADLEIVRMTDAHEAIEIPVREVRAKLDAAGVHWGRTTLSGRAVVVRARKSDLSPPLAMTPAAIPGAVQQESSSRRQPPQPLEAADLAERATLRGEIARFIARGLAVDPSELRLTFDERDAALLDDATRRVGYEIEPAGALRRARVDLIVRLWSDGRVAERRSMSASPLVRTPVVVLRDAVDRGAVIQAEHVEVVHQWLAPNQVGLLSSPDDAAGRLAAVRLREGDILRVHHVRRENIVRRGEQITVRCIVGGAVIKLQAEARSDGALGESIELRKHGERDTFVAVITGRGEAILDLTRGRESHVSQ